MTSGMTGTAPWTYSFTQTVGGQLTHAGCTVRAEQVASQCARTTAIAR